MENTLRVMTAEETKITRKISRQSFPRNKCNKGKVNFQHLQYETKVTGFSWSM